MYNFGKPRQISVFKSNIIYKTFYQYLRIGYINLVKDAVTVTMIDDLQHPL